MLQTQTSIETCRLPPLVGISKGDGDEPKQETVHLNKFIPVLTFFTGRCWTEVHWQEAWLESQFHDSFQYIDCITKKFITDKRHCTIIDITVHKNLLENTITDGFQKREHDIEDFNRDKTMVASRDKFRFKGEKPKLKLSALFLCCIFWVPFSKKDTFFIREWESGKKLKFKNKKQIEKTVKLTHQPKQQHAQPALAYDDTESRSGLDKELNDGMNKDLIDGKYKKTVNVKTLNGKTISIKYDPLDTVDSAKQQLERKTSIPKEQQHLVSRGRVLKDKMKIEDCNMKEGETIELIAALLGGTKREESRSISRIEERESKRNVSEPNLEICGMEESKSTSNISEKNGKDDAKDGRNNEVNEIPDG